MPHCAAKLRKKVDALFKGASATTESSNESLRVGWLGGKDPNLPSGGMLVLRVSSGAELGSRMVARD